MGKEIVASAAAENAKLFEETALPFLDQMFSTALHLTQSETDAQDLVQETFLRAYNNFDRFRPGTNIRAWLRKIMTNIYLDQYRKKKRRISEAGTSQLSDWQELRSQQAVGVGPLSAEMEALSKMPDANIVRAFETLSEPYRQAVYLVDIEGFSYREAAAILDVEVGTIMSRLSRGRKALRKALGEVAQEYGIGESGKDKGANK